MANSTFIYKPGTDKGPVFLAPDSGDKSPPTFILSDGTRVQGRYLNTNEGRHQFVLPNSVLGQKNLKVEYGGQSATLNDGNQSYEGGNLGSLKERSKGSVDASGNVVGGTGPGGTTTTQIGGSTVVLPQGVDYSSLPTPHIDLNTAYSDAYNQGGRAQQELISSLSDPRLKNIALDTINTDTQGILNSAKELAPFNRQQGNLDNTTNINRAGEIDTFNLSRTPQFNDLNRNEKNKAVDSTGIKYRDRINSYLDDITKTARGELPVGLDKGLTNQVLDEGADIASSSGISGGSRAGKANSARLNAREKLTMMNNASARLGTELRASQQTLEAPIIQAKPTEVPLTVSKVADSLPVKSSLSAGQIQNNTGKDLASLNSIDAKSALNTNLDTQRFNTNAEYERAKTILNAQQGIITATEGAVQSGFNQEKTDDAAKKQQFRNDLAAGIKTFGSVAGFFASPQGGTFLDYLFGAGSSGTNNSNGNYGVGQYPNTTYNPNAPGYSSQDNGYNLGNGTSTGTNGYPTYPTQNTNTPTPDSGTTTNTNVGTSTTDTTYNTNAPGYSSQDSEYNLGNGTTDQAKFKVGKTSVSNSDVSGYQNLYNQKYGNLVNASNTLNSGVSKNLSSTQLKQTRIENLAKNPSLMGIRTASQKTEYNADQIGYATRYLDHQEANNPYVKASRPLTNHGQDLQILGQGVDLVGNYDSRNTGQNIGSLGQFGANVLESRDYINGEQARNIRGTSTALQTLSNPNATSGQKAAAVAQLGAVAATDGYTGDIANPNTIGGQRVLSSTTTNGEKAYTLADGSTVSQSYLANVQTSINGIKVIGILTSNASDQDKVLALTSIGIDTARANQIISQGQAGYGTAALGILGTSLNWDKMNDVQKSVSVIQNGVNIAEVMGTNTAQTGTGITAGYTTSLGADGVNYSLGSTQTLTTGSESLGTSGTTASGTTAATNTTGSTASTIASAAPYVAAAVSLYQYGVTAQNVINKSSDSTKSQAGNNALNAFKSGNAVAGFYGGFYNAAISVVGSVTASGKDTSQMMRDRYRTNLKDVNIIEKGDNNSYNVTLADKSKYDIGLDGSNKITNNGASRYTFDVDWNNKLAVDAVPAGNLFSIATGLDPTSGKSFDLFSRSVGQNINAATSNAKTNNDVYANYRAMLKNKITPDQIGIRLEYLRATNKISESEYGVYLDQTNKMFGSKYKPTDRKQANTEFVNSILVKAPKDRTKEDKRLLEEFTNKDKRGEQRQTLLDRINKERKDSKQPPLNSLGYDDVEIGAVDLGTNDTPSTPVGTTPTAQTNLLTSQTRVGDKANTGTPRELNNIRSTPGRITPGQGRVTAKPFTKLNGDTNKLKLREGVRPTYGK